MHGEEALLDVLGKILARDGRPQVPTIRVIQTVNSANVVQVDAREVSFSLEDLKTLFPVVTFPVTICCAGNRRREQNLFRKTLGFSWGSAGGAYS